MREKKRGKKNHSATAKVVWGGGGGQTKGAREAESKKEKNPTGSRGEARKPETREKKSHRAGGRVEQRTLLNKGERKNGIENPPQRSGHIVPRGRRRKEGSGQGQRGGEGKEEKSCPSTTLQACINLKKNQVYSGRNGTRRKSLKKKKGHTIRKH